MARFAPSPAKGDIRGAASPSSVTPGVRGQLCPSGNIQIDRGTKSPSLLASTS
jgi:hypothetical protein